MARRIVAVLLPLFATACLAPPVVRPGGPDRIDVARFPPATEVVEIPVGGAGDVLRGVWLAGDGRPTAVVVHFQGTGESIASGWQPLPRTEIVWQVRDLGLGLLVVDYRGVGASTGERHADHLREDARAVYRHALVLAGDEARIALRGNSLGGLALATLLQEGARPAAVVVSAPVLDDTVVYNRIADDWGGFVAWLIDALVFRRPVGVDLVEELRRCVAPQLVLTGSDDVLLADDGRARLLEALRDTGAIVLVEPGFSHLDAAIEGNALLPGERELYERLFPATVQATERVRRLADAAPDARDVAAIARRWRLDPPHATIALARLAAARPDLDLDVIVDWFRALPATPSDPAGLDALLSFDDPAGPLDPGELEGIATFIHWRGPDEQTLPVDELPGLIGRERLHRRAFMVAPRPRGFGRAWRMPESIDLDGPHDPGSLPSRLRLDPASAKRQVLRLLLKCRGIPDRIVHDDDGAHVEWRGPDGRWQRVGAPDR